MHDALACIVGKTINITGTFYVPVIGTPIGVSREATISADLFKVKMTGGDGVSERPEAETKIETWEGDYVGLAADGVHHFGFQDETEADCFKVEYKKGPFTGPGGAQCSTLITARICPDDDCHIEAASWEVKCGVNPDGTGGTTRASGEWAVQP